MRIKFMTKKTISQVLSVVLLCALCFGAVFGISALSNKLKEDKKVIHPVFEVGGIDSEGKGDKDMDTSIYTKEAFACDGLEIKLDFDAKVAYSVYFYTKHDSYVGSSLNNTTSKRISVPYNATHARLVIIPIWDDDVKNADRVCHWYDTAKYSSQLEIKVYKDQNVDGLNLYKHDPEKEGKIASINGENAGIVETDGLHSNYCYTVIDVTGMEKVEVIYKEGKSTDFAYYFGDSDLNPVGTYFNTTPGETSIMIDVPDGAAFLVFNYNFENQVLAVYER